LIDSEADVRYEAYSKLSQFKIKIEDFDSPETRMLIIKEGTTDQDPRIRRAFVDFLMPSIVHESPFEIEGNAIKAKIKKTE